MKGSGSCMWRGVAVVCGGEWQLYVKGSGSCM